MKAGMHCLLVSLCLGTLAAQSQTNILITNPNVFVFLGGTNGAKRMFVARSIGAAFQKDPGEMARNRAIQDLAVQFNGSERRRPVRPFSAVLTVAALARRHHQSPQPPQGSRH